jgi:hypothetical protein
MAIETARHLLDILRQERLLTDAALEEAERVAQEAPDRPALGNG